MSYTKFHFFYLILSSFLFTSCKQSRSTFEDHPNFPAITVTDVLGDTTVLDPYRPIENLQDSSVISWLEKEAAWSENILSHISGREQLQGKIQQLVDQTGQQADLLEVTSNNAYYYTRETEDGRAKLFYKASSNAPEELIYDPINYLPDASESDYVINFIQPSWDGSKVVIALHTGGLEISDMLIYDRDKQALLDEVITNAWPSDFSGVQWLPNNQGFIYLHYPVIDPEHPDFLKNMESVVYFLGDDPTKLNPILSKSNNPTLGIQSEDFPMVFLEDQEDAYLLGYIAGGEAYYDAYYAAIQPLVEGKPLEWKLLHKKSDKVNELYVVDDTFIFKSAKENAQFNIYAMPVGSDFHDAQLLIEPTEEEVISSFKCLQDRIFYATTKNGVEASLYQFKVGTSKKLDLPVAAGSLELSLASESAQSFFISCIGWTTNFKRYTYSLEDEQFKEADLFEGSAGDWYKDYVVKEVLAPSHDGEMVPLSIIHKKDIQLDGSNPTFFFGYGAYSFSAQPYFLPIWLSWVEEGGIFCIAHVRGGGEKGSDWYEGGKIQTKPNTWKDLIACVEYMIEQKYTSSNKTAAYAVSAGGIMVGRAMTERPDLFQAVIAGVGLMNPSRAELAPNGDNGIKEFGSRNDSAQARALIAMDPYLHIREGKEYPATLITTGMNDPRVTPWIPAKFAARLQASQGGEAPIFFDVDMNSGHGMGEGQQKEIERMAKLFSFAFWQLGHEGYEYNP